MSSFSTFVDVYTWRVSIATKARIARTCTLYGRMSIFVTVPQYTLIVASVSRRTCLSIRITYWRRPVWKVFLKKWKNTDHVKSRDEERLVICWNSASPWLAKLPNKFLAEIYCQQVGKKVLANRQKSLVACNTGTTLIFEVRIFWLSIIY